jgi:hypothetical protein
MASIAENQDVARRWNRVVTDPGQPGRDRALDLKLGQPCSSARTARAKRENPENRFSAGRHLSRGGGLKRSATRLSINRIRFAHNSARVNLLFPTQNAQEKFNNNLNSSSYGRQSTTHHPPQQHRKKTLRRPRQEGPIQRHSDLRARSSRRSCAQE